MTTGKEARVVTMPFADALVSLGQSRSDVVVLSADLSNYTDLIPFRDAFPDRFFQVGMAEQNMMGIAGGLARSGLLPIAVTYGVFATRRAYDQVAMALGTGTVKAIIVAFLPGITTPFRATHQATDDLALMRAIPGMTVIDPADSTELRAALHAAAANPGTVYLRGLRGLVEERFDPEGFIFAIGAARLVRDGPDAAIVGTGLGTAWALDASEILAARGISASLLHVPTLKPLDREAIAALAARFAVVHVVENHSVVGGLASAVAEVIAGIGAPTRVNPIGVPDQWAPAGSLDYIRSEINLSAVGIADRVLATWTGP
ncbi:MAG: transketolase family protein [Actinomycetota bacterium]|nr:transketolase family protein [Actinomycetota bacterium]